MADKKANAIRFAVGNKGDLHSAVWRLWGSGDSFYLAVRGVSLKLSFHQGGKKLVRLAPHSNTPRPSLLSWSPPSELFPGWTVAFGILVPPRITTHPFRYVLNDDKPVELIDPPTGRTKAVFQISVADKAAQEADMMRLPADKKYRIHGRVEMKREAAWLISFYDRFTLEERLTVVDHFNKLKIHPHSESGAEDIRSSFAQFFDSVSNPPNVMEIQLGKEKIEKDLMR
jgi:hypothetical protein